MHYGPAMRRSLAVAATVLGLSVLPACGGGDSLSKEDFLAQGDAICTQLDTETGEVAEPTSEQEFGPYIEQIVVFAEQAREDFSALSPPGDGEQVQEELVGALDVSIENARGAVTAADEGDTVTAGDLLTQAAEAGEAANEAAREYGFQACGAGS